MDIMGAIEIYSILRKQKEKKSKISNPIFVRLVAFLTISGYKLNIALQIHAMLYS